MPKKKKISKKQAVETAKKALNKAKTLMVKQKDLSKKYVQKARRATQKLRVKMPTDIKRQFCKHCKSYLIPGKNLRVRTQEGKLVYYCLECKKHWRMPIAKEKKPIVKK